MVKDNCEGVVVCPQGAWQVNILGRRPWLALINETHVERAAGAPSVHGSDDGNTMDLTHTGECRCMCFFMKK